MSKMRIEDFKKIEFYQIPKWVLQVKGLKPIDILIYMLAFNNWKLSLKNELVNDNGEIYFFLTHDSIRKDLDVGKDQVIDSIKRLVKSKIIIAEKSLGKATKYYLENDLSNIDFNPTKSKKSSTENPTSKEEKIDHTSTENPTTDQSDFTDINKTDLLNNNIITTTKLDNINYIEQSTNQIEKISSSSSLEIKTIKKYLQENVKDIPTCKNIMELVNSKNLKLEKLQEVIEYANKNQKGFGYIVNALKNDWEIPTIQDKVEKREYARGQKVNIEAINNHIEAEKNHEEFNSKRENLNCIYDNLEILEKKKIDDEAYKLAVKECGVVTAKIMARTKYKYEILEKYYLENKKGA